MKKLKVTALGDSITKGVVLTDQAEFIDSPISFGQAGCITGKWFYSSAEK
jgi:hypothetical protein